MTKKTNFKFYYVDVSTALDIPLFKGGLQLGFPSPADDYMAGSIDLNKRLIKKPSATFFGIADGDSMEDAYIHDGDLVIVDRSEKVKQGLKILCCLDGEFTIKYIHYDKEDKNIIWLVPANKKYKRIKVTQEMDFRVWGIVTFSITPHIDKFD